MKASPSGIREFMIMPTSGNLCKDPNKIGPPLAYMEERGVFKPLDTTANPLGLCWFYHTDPEALKDYLRSEVSSWHLQG